MNLSSGFQIGLSGLAAGQSAMNIAGNNMANASTPGYRRQRLGMTPIAGQPMLGLGQFGGGVRVAGLSRAIDMALLSRLRHARGDEAGLLTGANILSGLEQSFETLGEGGVAGGVEAYLSAWGQAAQAPSDPAIRGVIIQQGVGLAAQMRELRQRLVLQRDEIDRSLQDGINRANELLTQIQGLTGQIQAAESSGGAAPSLRDQRDLLIDELSTLVDLSVVDRPDGSLDLLVGSTPIMLSGASLGIGVVQTQAGSALSVLQDGAPLAAGGALGALIARRADGVQAEISRLDTMARALINTVNRLHIEGRGLHGRTTAQSFYGVTDSTIPLGQVPLQSPVTAGVIRIQLGPTGSENPTVIEIQVDPSADSLAQVAALINGSAGNLTATVDGQNRLRLDVPAGWEFSILEDQTGLFTAIQLGGFFTGVSSSDIAVAQELIDDPLLLSVAHGENASAVAVAISSLKGAVNPSLGASLGDWWRTGDASLASRIRAMNDSAAASSTVRLGLEAHQQAISGVNLDEEAMNLIAAQTQFEAAARYVSALEQALQTLLAMAAR